MLNLNNRKSKSNLKIFFSQKKAKKKTKEMMKRKFVYVEGLFVRAYFVCRTVVFVVVRMLRKFLGCTKKKSQQFLGQTFWNVECYCGFRWHWSLLFLSAIECII